MVYPLLEIAGTVKGQRDTMILADRAGQLLELKFYKTKKVCNTKVLLAAVYTRKIILNFMERQVEEEKEWDVKNEAKN